MGATKYDAKEISPEQGRWEEETGMRHGAYYNVRVAGRMNGQDRRPKADRWKGR